MDACSVSRLWHRPEDMQALIGALQHVHESIKDSNRYLDQVRCRYACTLPTLELSTLQRTLSRLCAPAAFTPLAMQAPLLCELAAFVARWSTDGVPVARAFASMASAWAAEFEGQLEALSASPVTDSDYTLKRVHLQQSCSAASMLAVLSLDFASPSSVTGTSRVGSLFSVADAQCLLRHLATMHFYRGESAQLESQRLRCLAVASRCAPVIGVLLEHPPDARAILSHAASGLFKMLPGDLTWTQSTRNYGCFVGSTLSSAAACHQRACYSFNVLTGCALRNGEQPARLPDTVTEHPLYKRTMGTLQFDVDDGMATRQPVLGRVYRFVLNQKHLTIMEEETVQGRTETLELIQGDAPICS